MQPSNCAAFEWVLTFCAGAGSDPPPPPGRVEGAIGMSGNGPHSQVGHYIRLWGRLPAAPAPESGQYYRPDCYAILPWRRPLPPSLYTTTRAQYPPTLPPHPYHLLKPMDPTPTTKHALRTHPTQRPYIIETMRSYKFPM